MLLSSVISMRNDLRAIQIGWFMFGRDDAAYSIFFIFLLHFVLFFCTFYRFLREFNSNAKAMRARAALDSMN